MLFWKYISLITLCSIVTGCGPQMIQRGRTVPYYVEDVAWVLPKKVVSTAKMPINRRDTLLSPPVYSLGTAIDALIHQRGKILHTEGFINGYSLQIYKGVSRNDAEYFLEYISDTLYSTVTYQQPYYTLWEGFFLDRLEGHRRLFQLKKRLSRVILVPRKIPIYNWRSVAH